MWTRFIPGTLVTWQCLLVLPQAVRITARTEMHVSSGKIETGAKLPFLLGTLRARYWLRPGTLSLMQRMRLMVIEHLLRYGESLRLRYTYFDDDLPSGLISYVPTTNTSFPLAKGDQLFYFLPHLP